MADKIINLQPTSEFLKGTADILLMPQFSGDKNKDFMFKKLEHKLAESITKRAKQVSYKAKKGESFIIHDTSDLTNYDAILFFGLGEKKECSERRIKQVMADRVREVINLKFETVALYLPAELNLPAFTHGKVISEALYLASYRYDTYMSDEEKKKQTHIGEISVYLGKSQTSKVKSEFENGVDFGRLISEGVNLARDMVNEPGQYMHPEALVAQARDIAKQSNGSITVKILGDTECKKLGMGAFLAVAQGSEHKPQFIVLHYQNNVRNKNLLGSKLASSSTAQTSTSGANSVASLQDETNLTTSLCLIGKSITFDSGGLSIKPSKSMETMKLDMAGGAAVLGVFKVLSSLSNLSNLNVYGILPACENMPSGKAIRPGDIVRALNGKTIEILNTDAEGRLALADALAYAEKYIKPDYIIDLATLTGAIMVALGPDITGLFANDKTLLNSIKEAAKEEGEELWPMPLYKPYAKKMKSDVADFKNVTNMGYGGAITAALFLKEFVKKTKWAHLDIAGAAYNEHGANGTHPKGGTGWGVQMLIHLLESGIRNYESGKSQN